MPGISHGELLARMAKGKHIPGILLYGDESYLREMCRRKIIDAYVEKNFRDWGITRFSAEDDSLSTILGQAQTPSMLAPQQVIFVSDVQAWQRLGDESRDELVDALSDYLTNPAPFSVLVFEADELDQRMRLMKVLAEKMVVVQVALSDKPEERAHLAGPIAMEMAREVGVELDRDAGQELAEILNGDLAAIHTELEKIAAYVGERKCITLADVELMVVSARKYSTWDLTDMLAAQQTSRALEFLKQPPARRRTACSHAGCAGLDVPETSGSARTARQHNRMASRQPPAHAIQSCRKSHNPISKIPARPINPRAGRPLRSR